MLVLALQKLSDTLVESQEQFDSTESHCCGGSTESHDHCCNETTDA